MIGIVISDSFLLTGKWEESDVGCTLNSLEKIDFNEPITSLLYNESELNSVLASALRKAKEIHSFDAVEVLVGLPDLFVEHSVLEKDQDLSKGDYLDYFQWLEENKGRPSIQEVYTHGEIYYPA